MSKKVLIITTPFRPNIGGVETHLDDLISEGVKKGLKFAVLTYQPLVTKARGKTLERHKGYTVYRIPWIRMNLFLLLEKYPALEFIYLFPPLFFCGLFFLLKNLRQISIIHAQGLVAGTIGVVLGKIFKKDVIISTHSIYNFPKKGFYPETVECILKICKQVLTLSQQSKEEIINLGIDPKRVSTFTYWVDQKVFSPFNKEEARAKLNLSNKNFICLFVGRLVVVKGIKVLLDAAKKIDEKVTFLIAGDGPMSKEVQVATSVAKNIIFAGKVNNKDLPIYYNAADVLVVPSIHEEGFGRVILEALSCGLPVIASNRGGIRESVTKDVGLLIEISAKNIIDAVKELLQNKKKLEVLRLNARKYALSRFSAKNARMIFRHYEK